MANDDDPVSSGFVASLARPGGNITGLSTLAPELSGKRLELLKEIIPKLSRVAVLGTSTRMGNAQSLKEVELAAGAFKVQVQYLDVLEVRDIETVFRAATKGRAEAVLVLQTPVFYSQRTQLVDLAAKNRLPAIYPQTEYTEAGGLMYYGANTPELFRRAATYVDKILKGAKPADLPVEQPTKFELVINLKTAKQIGLTIPPSVLVKADKDQVRDSRAERAKGIAQQTKRGRNLMRRNVIRLTLCAMLFALCLSALAQQPTKTARIGYLSVLSPASDSARIEAFRQGLRELRYVDGKNIDIESRYAEGSWIGSRPSGGVSPSES